MRIHLPIVLVFVFCAGISLWAEDTTVPQTPAAEARVTMKVAAPSNAKFNSVVTKTPPKIATLGQALTADGSGKSVWSNVKGTTIDSGTNSPGAVLQADGAGGANWNLILGTANGGTGSPTQNFVDLTTNQSVAGNKAFSGNFSVSSAFSVEPRPLNAPVAIPGSNIFIGTSAGALNTSAYGNSFVGFQAGANNSTGFANSFIGTYAGRANTTGIANNFFGGAAGMGNTIGSYNNYLGTDAGYANDGGSYNSFFGDSAGSSTVGANYNSFFGAESGYYNTTGSYNSFVGYNAGYSNTTATANNFFGANAGYSTISGGSNTFAGDAAGYANTGANNTFVGAYAGHNNTTGANNIAVGRLAGNVLTTGSNNIDIGHAGVAAEANTIRIGTSGTQTIAYLAGVRGVTTGQNNAVNVVIDSNGQLGTISSSRRYKEDIADMGDASAKLQALRPVTFRYKKPYSNGEKPIQYGLIAEEVAASFPDLAVFNAEGKPETVKYQDLAPLLLNEYQKEHKKVEALEARLARLEKAREDGQPRTIPATVETK
jgi:hypothetical protein